MKNMSPAYVEAIQPGGRHHGWYRRLQDQSDAELEKSVRSFERQIVRHEGWIADPSSKTPDFGEFHPQRKLALVEGWQQDVARQRECIDILRDILEERKNGQA